LPYESSLGPEAGESSGVSRVKFDDADDYNGYLAAPPVDFWGDVLGSGGSSTGRHPSLANQGNDFSAWRQRIEVYYVDPANPQTRRANNQPSDYRAVEVTIERIETNGSIRPLATARRVFCYVPIP
jgi:hypothetical protein